MINKTEARENFSYLKTNKIYFNHTSIGPMPHPVKKAVDKFLAVRNLGEIENYQAQIDITNRAKARTAKMLNASANEIAFIDNVANGMNILANGIKWEKGDCILLNDLEFPSNVYPFLNLKNSGVEVDFVKSRDGIIYLEDIKKLITEKTKLISISLVQFLTGQKMPVEELGKICRERNIIFSVDAIQAAGNTQIDVRKANIDFLAGGAQKWLCGLQGTSFIYVSAGLQKDLQQKFVGWTSVKNAWNMLDYNLDLKEDASRFMNGTYSAIGVTALETSLKFFESLGYDEIEKSVKQNTVFFLDELNKLSIKTILSSEDEAQLSGIISCRFDDPGKVYKTLQEENISCAQREGMIRFSPHFYNTEEEIEKVISVLKKVK